MVLAIDRFEEPDVLSGTQAAMGQAPRTGGLNQHPASIRLPARAVTWTAYHPPRTAPDRTAAAPKQKPQTRNLGLRRFP